TSGLARCWEGRICQPNLDRNSRMFRARFALVRLAKKGEWLVKSRFWGWSTGFSRLFRLKDGAPTKGRATRVRSYSYQAQSTIILGVLCFGNEISLLLMCPIQHLSRNFNGLAALQRR